MQVFRCNSCNNLVFFENTTCIDCGSTLAFLPHTTEMRALQPAGNGLWKLLKDSGEKKPYRLCENYSVNNVCNWAIPAEEDHTLCSSCRFTQKIHDQSQLGASEIWYKLEVAKRRLLYSLLILGCPLENKQENPEQGLAFEFLTSSDNSDDPPVLTGHANGLITLNVAEADDVERKRRQVEMGEPYRTLLGHFRHEVGHYYWDRLVANSPHLEQFRELFGDERADYGEALQQYYSNPRIPNWQDSFISEYATAHPWEDWAESWAHYLHMTDTLETALDCGLTIKPHRRDEPTLNPSGQLPHETDNFDQLIGLWFPLTYVLNNLNRGLGMPDNYPFVISPPVIEKLKFIHGVIRKEAILCEEKDVSRRKSKTFWENLFRRHQPSCF